MIYLDNCATTKPREEVIRVITDAMRDDFGNPSSLHRKGFAIEKKIKSARKVIADYLGVSDGEIYFTSGGTEGNNMAIMGVAEANPQLKHVITTGIEHPAVMNTIRNLEKNGYSVTVLENDEFGRVNLDHLQKSLRQDTFLVSIIHVNNEIGTIQKINEIGKIVKGFNSQIHLHVDGVQSFGKIDFSLIEAKVDSYAFSSHKVYGPKGVGGLYISRKAKIKPIIYGGGQERGIRSGTENTFGILGFAKAVEIISTNQIHERRKVLELRQILIQELKIKINDIKINSLLDQECSPYILSVSFSDTKGEVIVHYLEEDEIYVSTSSACSSKGTKKSHVLEGIGLENKYSEGTIRICLSHDLSTDEIELAATKIAGAVREIRNITRR